jgi:hypothetical protein
MTKLTDRKNNMVKNTDNSKQNPPAKSTNTKCGPPKKKMIDLSNKAFSPSKTGNNNLVDVYVCGMTHGVVVMRTERSSKKNVEGFVQPLKNKCTNEPEFAKGLDIIKVRQVTILYTVFICQSYYSQVFLNLSSL